MAGLLRAGQYELQEAKIVSMNGTEVDLTLSLLSLTLFEDIFRFTISGVIVVQDSVNLSSMLPLIGQEYLILKISTPTLDDSEFTIDFTNNVLHVNKIYPELQYCRNLNYY